MTADTAALAQMLKALRRRLGASQAALGERLGVDQKTISRWEAARDTPSMRHQRRIRELMRGDRATQIDTALRTRVRHALWPATLLGRGAVVIEASRHLRDELGLDPDGLRGQSLYGRFGEATDETTRLWEESGVFDGEIALTESVNCIAAAEHGEVHFRTLDYPHMNADGEIWCVCELRRVSKADYDAFVSRHGATTASVGFDAVFDDPDT